MSVSEQEAVTGAHMVGQEGDDSGRGLGDVLGEQLQKGDGSRLRQQGGWEEKGTWEPEESPHQGLCSARTAFVGHL